MKLDPDEATAKLVAHDHGVLSTIHTIRGVDAVPVVYVVDPDGFVGVPIDLVKPKASGRLQRERNLENDPRATLLIEHWDRDDWSKLWWVRAELRHDLRSAERAEPLADLLAQRFVQYEDKPFAQVLVFRTVNVTGWTASTSI